MPFIMTKVNRPVSRKQELALKSWLGRAVGSVPGKSEASLLAGFQDDCRLYLRGDDEAAAYVEVSMFANEEHLGYERLSAEIARMFQEVLGIAPDHVYIRYDDISAWSVGGVLFDRRAY